MNDLSCGPAPPRAAARAVPPRLDARGRRGDARHHVHRVAADRGAGPGGGHGADRAGRAAGAADPGRAAVGLLAADEVDLALTYDYNLAPARFGRGLQAEPLARTPWHLGTPSGPGPRGTAVEVFRRYRDDAWIVNSRNTADEDVVRIVASLADFEPRITQRADSLDLVHDMILAGLGVGLLPVGRPAVRGVTLRRLRQPEVILRSYAVTRRGHAAWPPLALVLRLVLQAASP